MALSQIQCLDDNHVNPRIHEAKPEFFYCEDQRLALEALLKDGREAFSKYLEVRRVRGFLSDLEQGTLTAAVEPFDPESEFFPGDADDDQTPLSLQYWPELSDTSIPQMDLGWPDSDSYRGVTRTSVYTQPPLEGQTHIKEVVRKTIAQAQKVIAVVMDVFTDVDIFRDLLDAGFKRKVPVYILLEHTRLPHFLSMCQRANMHTGHLKHLRVGCTGGAEFYTRHCTKVRGQMGHRFMFIDGDKAVSGSYSFTWMSSRLDRNLITVTTGQAVDAFDQLFRLLYLTSTSVNLQKVATEPEPEPDLRPQVAAVAPPSAAVIRKMYNPKYALVALSNPSPTTSVGNDGPKEPEVSENSKKKNRRKASEDLAKDAPPLHPGLTNLEKAYLIPYLPTWPEPDPPSDVIGFINIRDASRPTQVHLQRSEMFETSQAIKFSSPLKPQETSPEVATPRQLTVKQEETNKHQPAQNKSAAEELVVDTKAPGQDSSKGKLPKQKLPPCSQGSASVKDETKVLKTENKHFSNRAINTNVGHDTPALSPDTPPQTSNKAPLSSEEKPSDKAETASDTSLKSTMDHNTLHLSTDAPPQSIPTVTSSNEEKPLDKAENASTTSFKPNDGHDLPGFRPVTPPHSSDRAHLSSEEKTLDRSKTASLKPNVDHQSSDLHPDTPSQSSNKTPSPIQEKTLDKAETSSATSFKPNVGHDLPDHPPDAPPQSSSKAPSPNDGHDLPGFRPDTPPHSSDRAHLSTEEKTLDKAETASTASLKPNVDHPSSDLHPDTPSQSSNKTPSPNEEKPLDKAETASTTSFKPNVGHDLPGFRPDTPPQLSDKAPLSSEEKTLERAETASTASLKPNVDHESSDLHPDTPSQSSNKTPSPNEEKPLDKAETASTTILKSNVGHSTLNLSLDTSPQSIHTVPSSNEKKLSDKAETASTTSLKSYIDHNLPDLCPDAPPQSSIKEALSENKASDKSITAFATSFLSNKGPNAPHLSLDVLPQSIHTAPSPTEKKPSEKAAASSTINPKLYVSHDAPDLHQNTPLQSSFKAPSFNENKASGKTETTFATNLKSDVGHTTFNLSPGTPHQCSNKTLPFIQEKPSDKAETASGTNLKSRVVHESPDLCLDTPPLSSFSSPSSNEEKPLDDVEIASRTSLMSILDHDSPHLSPETPPKYSNIASSSSEKKPSNKTASTVSPNSNIGHDIPDLSPHAPLQSSKKASLSNQEGPLVKAETASTTHLMLDSVTETSFDKEDATVNTQSTVVYKTHTVNLLPNPTHSNILDTQEKTVVSHSDSHIKAVNTQPKVPSEVTHNLQTPRGLGDISTSSASLARSVASTLISKNNPIAITTEHSSTSSPWTTYPSTTSPSPLPLSVSPFTSLPSLTSSASAFLTSLPPIPNPHTVQLASKDSSDSNNQMVSEISSARRLETSAEMQMVHSVPALVNMVETCPVKNLDAAPGNSATEMGDEKDTKNSSNPINASQKKQLVSSQETKKKKDGQDYRRAGVETVRGTKLQTESDVLIMDTPMTANVNIQEIIPKNDDSKILILTSTKTNSEHETTVQPENTLTNCELAKVTQSQTYLARSHEPQRISFSKFTSQDKNVLEATNSSKALALSTSQDPYIPIDDVVDRIHTSAANTLQPGQQAEFVSAQSTDSVLNALKYNTHTTFQDQSHKTPLNTPERPLHLNLSLAQAPGLNSPTTKRNSPLFQGVVKASNPDVFPPRSPTPDSRTTSPNPQSYTPDFRTPTSDISDGYISPGEDSTFSNTSEEYYECSDSPMHDPVLEPSENQNQEMKENYIRLMYANISSAITRDSSPAYQNYNPTTATLGTLDKNSPSEASVLFRTSGASSSSLLGTVRQNFNPKETNEVEDEIWIKRSNMEKTDQESQWTEGTNNQESNKRMTHLQVEDDFIKMAAKVDEIGAPMQTRVLINSAADGVVDREVTTGEAARRDTKQISTGDPKPEKVSFQMERPEKAYTGGEKPLLKSMYEDTRERQSTRDTTVQKLCNSYSKSQRFHHQDSGFSSSSPPLRPPRPLSGSQVPAARPLGSQTERKVYYSGFKVLNNTSSPPRQLPTPLLPSAVVPVGRKQVSHSLLSQQSPAAQIRLKSDQLQSETPRPSYHHTFSNLQPQVGPPDLILKASEPGVPENEEGRVPFNFPFGRLYNFKGLRDKWTRLPTQSKRSSTDSTVKEHKSTN